MSNFLAIATVTTTLKNLLQNTTANDVKDHEVKVVTGRPDSTVSNAQETKINLYLYQVTPNAFLRNNDLPTRRSDGTILQRPKVALDLHYMISFYGDESDLVTQRMLGSVVRTLHAQPQLTRDNIRQAILHGPAFLAPSDLADDVELVKFSPLHLSLEELSKIWSIFYQIPYTLSVAYQATVVLIETDDMPFHTLPVRRRNIYAVPFQQPTIERVGTTEGDDVPIDMQSTLRMHGRNLKGDITLVQIDGLEVVPDANNVSNTEITLVLADVEKTQLTRPPARLQAGVQGIQVIHRFQMGMDTADKPLEAHRGVESNVAAFVLRPRITEPPADVAGSGVLTVKVEPAVSKTQRVVLLLNEISPNAGQRLDHPVRRYTFDQRIIDANDPDPNNTLKFSVKDVVAGTYLVRVQVDGAESLLEVDTSDPKSLTFNTYVGGPKVAIS